MISPSVSREVRVEGIQEVANNNRDVGVCDNENGEVEVEEHVSMASNDSSVIILSPGMTFSIEGQNDEDPYNKFDCITWMVTDVGEEEVVGKAIWPNEAVILFANRRFDNKNNVAKWVKTLSNGS